MKNSRKSSKFIAFGRTAAKRAYKRGLRYFDAQNYGNAVKWFTKAAVRGSTEAQLKLVYCYRFGIGVAKDDVKALEWYDRAANAGNAEAQYGVACFYYSVGNYKNAIEWYKKAVALGNADAQYTFAGFCYKSGDFERAVAYYTKAAMQGHAKAQYSLGKCYQDGEGVERDGAAAVHWYFKSAALGNLDAQYALAERFRR